VNIKKEIKEDIRILFFPIVFFLGILAYTITLILMRLSHRFRSFILSDYVQNFPEYIQYRNTSDWICLWEKELRTWK